MSGTIIRLGRLVAMAVAATLVLALTGDGGRAATVPAVVNGQDPLEVLSLKVRPNVIVVLDSSGSMKWTLDPRHNNTSPVGRPIGAGDHPRSKLWQAKQVLKTIVENNQDKVSFLFGQYTNGAGPWIRNTEATKSTTGGQNRFIYWTTDQASPSMATTQLSVEGSLDESGSTRGLQSWQVIHQEWRTLWFEEQNGAFCEAALSGSFPRFYARGGSGTVPSLSTTPQNLSFDLQTAMNNAACTGGSRENTYAVTYSTVTGEFLFTAEGPSPFRLLDRAAIATNNISEALGGYADTSTWVDPGPAPLGGTARTSAPAYTLLFREATPPSNDGSYGDSWDTIFHNTFEEEVPPGSGAFVTNYQLRAARYFNGEVLRVTALGQVCDMTFPGAAEMTNPPTLTLQQVEADCGADVGEPVILSWGGGYYNGGDSFCDGFQPRVSLVPCDLQRPEAPEQLSTIGPWLENEAPLDANGTVLGYSETTDGTWSTATEPDPGGVASYGATPIAWSLRDIKGLFEGLWYFGQNGSTNMAGPPPYQLDPISTHVDPKEKTIVLFITDGDDTCSDGANGNENALTAARQAELLYQRLDANEPASSVQTFAIGYGGTVSGGRLNWIAWGGSGLGDADTGQPDVPVLGDRWNPPGGTDSETSITNDLAPLRAQCTTCEDAFIAPDSATLARQLQAIIEQGASSGEFTAQQSITESIFEYVDLASDLTATPPTEFDARMPVGRFEAIVPTRVISSFTLPGFRGRLRAVQNDGSDNLVERWEAGEGLRALVADGMGACDTSAQGGGVGQCGFTQLHAGATDASVATSAAAIKRRIYTTERNGVYGFDVATLIDGIASQRVTLWPPVGSIIPPDYSSEAVLPGGLSFDATLGLPLAGTAYPDPPDPDERTYDPLCDPFAMPSKSEAQCWFEKLQRDFGACMGTNLPSVCTSGTYSEKMIAARREAREMILAFTAGAEAIPANPGIKRASATGGGVSQHDILYRARSWVLADSELATPALVRPPLAAQPVGTPWLSEYTLFRDGARNGTGQNPDSAGDQIRRGFGLRNPDKDGTVDAGDNDSRAALKPVMSVVYAPANDMLHAFRAGPNISPASSCSEANPAHECGGQELWGFVPFDQLETLRLRLVHEPQGRDNHVYMLARGVRFSDVFVAVPSTDNPPVTVSIGGVPTQINGVWRRILYIPRGVGGKHITALDVTAPGPYTADALDTLGPIPLWSRGNPDTHDGTGTGNNNNDAADRLAYSAMGETWSIPAVAFRDKSANTASAYTTIRRPDGVDYALYMGSGYGATGEGTTFYTLDALSGDVLADVDVEIAASVHGMSRTGLPYPNALVANAVGFNPSSFAVLQSIHPSASAPERMYIGDVHGRFWKILTRVPGEAIPIADLGEDQPVGTAASILGLPPRLQPTLGDEPDPFVFVSSGNDRRVEGPFKSFAFRDDGTDDQFLVGSQVFADGVSTFPPAVLLFTRPYAQGEPEASCGYLEEAYFRGTVQPATAIDCGDQVEGAAVSCSTPLGRVFFAGTRLNPPNTVFAPPTPLACGLGDYPCRSSFDSIIYALGATSGIAAYDLNASGDDAYRIFRDSRIAAISMLADPDPTRGGSRFGADEGLMKDSPKPPPPPGIPPIGMRATANVIMERNPGAPPPITRYGSTICQ